MTVAPKSPTASEALFEALSSRTAICLYVAFFGLELLNTGLLPAALGTMKARTTAAKAITEQAKADTAKLLRDSEAAFATEDARAKTEVARQSERYRQAEARKQDNLAKIMREMALNSPEFRAGETEVKHQTAVIDNEKARHEERRARFEAIDTAANAELAALEERLRRATYRANIIAERVKALDACKTRVMAELGNQSPGLLWDLSADGQQRFRYFRSKCPI